MDPVPSPRYPARKNRFVQVASVGVVALAMVVQLRFFDRASVPMDEGQLVVIASRILDGQVLYRDMHTGIGPGIYHFTAALFALFGEDLVVTRWAEIGVNAIIALLLWLLSIRVVRLHWAMLAPAAFLFLITAGFPVLTMLNYSSLALLTALSSLLMLLRYLESGRSLDGFALGGLLALTALTKQNYGVFSILAAFIAIPWMRRETPLAENSLARSLLPVVASGGAVAISCMLYFASRGALPDLIRATLIDLHGSQLEAFSNPIPSILGALPRDDPRFVFLYTPPALFNHMMHGGLILGLPISPVLRETTVRLSYGLPLAALLLVPFALRATRHQHDARNQREASTIVLFAALFFLGIFPSAIWSHLAFVLPPTLLVLALLFDRLEEIGHRRFPRTRWIGIACSTLLTLVFIGASVRIAGIIQGWFPVPLGLPRASVSVAPDQAKLYRGAVAFISRCAAPGETTLSLPDIPLVQFLAARPNPTPYELMIPGNVRGDIIIRRLETDETRCIVYNPRMYPEFDPFEELFPEVSAYLRENYRKAAVIRGEGSEWYGLMRNERDDSAASIPRRRAPSGPVHDRPVRLPDE